MFVSSFEANMTFDFVRVFIKCAKNVEDVPSFDKYCAANVTDIICFRIHAQEFL